jgi:DNA polymerase III subunit alpha
MPEFVHLHNHTHYSLLDGACTVDALVAAAVEQQMTSVGLTDHGVNFGLLEFYKKAKSAGIKPILGCEVYVADGSRRDRSLHDTGKRKKRNYFHLVLLAKNYEGYRTLNKLTSRAHTEGFYYKPRIDRELLESCHDGLIALSACAGGVVSAHLVQENMEAAREAAIWYRELFGEDFYLEVQNHGIPVDQPVLEGMPLLANELNIPLIATNDCHYIRQEHAIAHNVLLHIRDASKNGVRIDIENELRYGTANYYFKSAAEMAGLLGHFPGAIENTVAIAEKCNVSMPKEFYMPNFPIPPESSATTLDEYLREITWKGVHRRYDRIDDAIKERVEFELDVIIRMGYSGYFLIVQDFIQAARDRGISVGPGRGSAAGSLVAYALWITNIDPMRYDLLFERFLNPDRVSMPDIDIDFADSRREEVIDYVKHKYGEEAVSQIITFGTLSARAVLKDVGRVLGVPLGTINSITEKIDVKFGRVQKIGEAIEGPELRWVKESTDPQLKKLIEYSQVLEGFCRNASLHAAGVVIAPGPLEEYIPLYKTPDSGLASQYTMKYLEEAGLLKMDFLGLRTLTIIDTALELIKQRHGVEIDIDAIPLDDRATYDMVGNGLTTAVFQFESVPMQKYLKDLKPSVLEDLIAMNALYRPGPMDNIPEFIERRHGRKEIEYLHKMLEPILGKTYGICVAGDTMLMDARTGRRFRIDEIPSIETEIYLQGVDENNERATGKVTHFICNGVRDVIHVRMHNGASVRMTPDHRVLTETGWKEIGQLAVGDYIAVPRDLVVSEPIAMSDEEVRLLAFLIADGSLTSGSSTDFVSKDEVLLSEFERCAASFERVTTRRIQQVHGVTRVCIKGTSKQRYHEPNAILAALREYGLKFDRGGHGSATKFVPVEVFGLPDRQIALFLASLWECDGHVGARLSHYKTISRTLAFDVQQLLLRVGIYSTIYESQYQRANHEGTRTAFQVSVYDLERFALSIGPHFISKSTSQCRFDTGENRDSVCRQLFLRELNEVWSGSARSLMLTHGFDRQHLYGARRETPRISCGAARAISSTLNLRQTRRNLNVRWERIEEISPAGAELVYDITVEGIHNFVGNGIVLHNCVYQEQIMQIAQQLGGFTLAQADNLRRAMGKKDFKLMEAMKATYQDGCAANKIEKKAANDIWEMMFKFADYGFNKSHSAAYAYVAYQTAYLKANYPPEFLAANMTAEAHDLAKVVKLIDECRKFGIKVLPPDVNESGMDFSVVDEGIRFGLAAIRNVGENAVAEILKQRESGGPFTSLFDFAVRLAATPLVNKRLVESLVVSGAFDSTHPNRRQLCESIDAAIAYASACASANAAGMDSLFASGDEGGGAIPEPSMVSMPDWTRLEKLSREKEVLNFYVSGHPLEEYSLEVDAFAQVKLGEIDEAAKFDAPVRACGIITAIRTKLDKRENQIAFAVIEDFTGKAECIFWSDAYKRFAPMVQVGEMVCVTGKAELNGSDGIKIIVDDIVPMGQARSRYATAIAVNVDLDVVGLSEAEQTSVLFKQHQGELQCIFRVYDASRQLAGRWVSRRFTVAPSRELIDGLAEIYGRGNVCLVGS